MDGLVSGRGLGRNFAAVNGGGPEQGAGRATGVESRAESLLATIGGRERDGSASGHGIGYDSTPTIDIEEEVGRSVGVLGRWAESSEVGVGSRLKKSKLNSVFSRSLNMLSVKTLFMSL